MKTAYKEYLNHRSEQLEISLRALYESTSADFILVAIADDDFTTATTLCMLQNGKLVENISYQLAGSPCEHATSIDKCIISKNVTKAYPQDELLAHMKIKTYVGEPIRSADGGEIIGILAALFKKNVANTKLVSTLFDAFSSRVASDILYGALNLRYQETLEELSHKHQLMQEIEVISQTGGWEYNVINEKVVWTDETFRIHGLKLQKAPSVPSAVNFYSDESQVIINKAFKDACDNGVPYNLKLELIDANGIKKWVQTNSKIRRDESGNITHVYGAIEDITEQHAFAGFLASTLNCLSDAVVVIDLEGIILLVNSATEDILEYSEEELSGLNVAVLMPQYLAQMFDKYLLDYKVTGEIKNIHVRSKLTAIKKSGQVIPVEVSLSESYQNAKPVLIGIIRDISERKEAQNALNQLAYFDSITTLPNSHSFERDFRKLLVRTKLVKGQLYAAIIDVDRFSEINLAYGLRSGDAVLLEIGARINRCLSENFKLYRALADGFILIYKLPITQSNQAIRTDILHQELAIKKAVGANMCVQNNQHTITVSIGSLIVGSDSAKHEAIVSLLEYSRKKVKTIGNNARILLTENDYQIFERQKLLRRSISSSLKNDEFFAVLQPKFDSDNNIVASELLLRWNHPVMGSVSPSEFIAVAEQSNDIVELSRWVFKQACHLIASAKRQGCSTKIAINVSGKDIIRPDFSSAILKTTKQYNVEPSSLILEITETILVSDIKLVASKIESLAKLGFKFSIDDFGTGYSSLAYLRTLKIHELKIDLLFIREISEKTTSPIVDSIIQMAKSLGLVTVAEGVETQLQLDYLKKQGCDLFQGYLLSMPISEKAWLDLLRSQHSPDTLSK